MQKIEVIKLFQSKKALVVDDFTEMRSSLKNMLKALGCESIDVACNGLEAVQCCSCRSYDLVLCDYNLGSGKSGQQVLEEIRFRRLLNNRAIFLMITAEASRDMVYGALEYLPDDYLTKPFTLAVLEKRLSKLVLEKDYLGAIYAAMDKKDYSGAIALCDAEVTEASRYRQKCLRIQAWCYFELKQFDQAKTIYEIVLGERDVEWARIGFGKCLLRQNKIEEAQRVLQGLLDQGVANTEVYDLLAEVEQRRGESKRAQELLSVAAKASPHAILRQKELARVCTANGDFPAARQAHQQVLRLNSNSCYESPENYLEYVRCLSAEIRQSDAVDKKLVKEAEDTLERTIKQYPDNPGVQLQSEFISAQLQHDARNTAEFGKRAAALAEKLEGLQECPPELALDAARYCQAIGQEDKAQAMLSELANRFAENEAVCALIDKTAREPVTRQGKEKAAGLNLGAKELFDKQDYRAAVRLIDEALVIFPSNTSLNLNLLAALVKQMQKDVACAEDLAHCQVVISRVGQLASQHSQFNKFTSLCKEVERLRSLV